MLGRFLVVGTLLLGIAGLASQWKFLLFLGYVVLFASCDNEIVQEAVSPDGRLRAVLFSRNCGATTGFQTQISIIESSDDLPDEPANTFITEGHPDYTRAELKWLDAGTLVVVTSAPDLAHKAERYVDGVTVDYVPR